MAVKLIDLQLIYGVAGAREKFEELAAQLVEGEQPNADKVRIERGDGGIDVYVGELTDPDGIDVYQCKFFPMGLDAGQKEQIRKSYRTCRDSKKFKTKSWTICLPVDLSIDEKKWFEEWRSDQSSSGITIGDPWGAMKLEGLLYQSKNSGLKESFFKEEHLAQIRTLHHMMTGLLSDLAKRWAASDTKSREELLAAEAAKHAEDLSNFIAAVRAKLAKLTPAPTLSFSGMQQTRKSGGRHISEILGDAKAQCSKFELALHPVNDSQKIRFNSVNEAWDKLVSHHLSRGEYQIPAINHQTRETGVDWIGSSNVLDHFADIWRVSQRGIFAYTTLCWSDAMRVSKVAEAADQGKIRDVGFRSGLDVREAVGVLTLMFAFAARYTEVLSSDKSFHLDISFLNIGERELVHSSSPISLRGTYRCNEQSLSHRWTFTREELKDRPAKLAAKAAVWFFERFNWPYVDEEIVAQFQK